MWLTNFHSLKSSNNIDTERKVYNALESDDLADIVMTALEILNLQTKCANKFIPQEEISMYKSEISSTIYREQGNNHFNNKEYKAALELYNKALMFAPVNSRAMALAYSNRSAILFKVNLFELCISDIEKSLAAECPSHIITKLQNRREAAEKNVGLYIYQYDDVIKNYAQNYFDVKQHQQIPYANIDVRLLDGEVKVTARSSIHSGKVITYEEPYMMTSITDNRLVLCHYCYKFVPNLIPCQNCCDVLYCSEDCKDLSFKEYHEIECKIMNFIELTEYEGVIHSLIFRTALKMKYGSSWNDFIKASKLMGSERIKSSNIETLNFTNKFSILCASENKPFIYGKKFNTSFVFAKLIQHLDKSRLFFPQSGKQKAMRAFARIMMHLYLYASVRKLYPYSFDAFLKLHLLVRVPSFGIYTFASKLNYSCKPNCLLISLNRKTYYIAIRNIKPGDELIVSDELFPDTDCKISAQDYNYVCDCLANKDQTSRDHISSEQKLYYNNLDIDNLITLGKDEKISFIFETTAKALDVLGDVPGSDEYKKVYRLFRFCLGALEFTQTESIFISPDMN
ncbi:unnamed protein product [Leptidea sinapis]|uniref:MYND-type domain-containing protein n=1 Tax=Leptidea sinapis TaxID=189913 RepID=A0A5E4PTP6_9NEOP|nr:unnamed protein product [Leptidea sinapis]